MSNQHKRPDQTEHWLVLRYGPGEPAFVLAAPPDRPAGPMFHGSGLDELRDPALRPGPTINVGGLSLSQLAGSRPVVPLVRIGQGDSATEIYPADLIGDRLEAGHAGRR